MTTKADVAAPQDTGTAVRAAAPRPSPWARCTDWALPSCVFAVLAVVNARRALTPGPAAHVVVAVGGTLLWVGLFLAVQRRPAPARRERSPLAVASALAATVVTVPIGAAEPSAALGRLVPAVALLVVGCAFSLWSIAVLGSRFGVLADARGLVVRGPYRIVRHPLYLGELVNLAGLVVAARSWVLPLAAWVALLVVQLVRAGYEERVLAAAFADYDAYCAAVPHRIVPGLV